MDDNRQQIMQKIKVIELFAGYGSQHLALKRLKRDYPEFDFEIVAFCEIDKYAIRAYNALHGDHISNLGDITKVNPYDVPDCDLMTWSFPCTDISSAGQQKGLAEGSDTRSSLCWDAMRIFEVKRPKYLLMENVSALNSQKFLGDFNKLQSNLQNLGYTNFFKLINAKDMGVPQNRLRIFMVSILDCPRAYYFPKPFKLERRLKDVLEQNVEERYYLSEKAISGLLRFNKEREEKGQGLRWKPKQGNDIGAAVLTTAGSRPCDNYLAICVTAAKRDNTQNYVMEPKVQVVGNIHPDRKWQGTVIRQQNLVVGDEGISPCITELHSNHAFKIAQATKEGYAVVPEGGVFDASYPDNESSTVTCEAQIKVIKPTIISPGHGYFKGAVNTETSPTVKCSAMQAQHFVSNGIRIRRLTERELYRLMDLEEPDIDTLLAAPIPRTQHAKLAGNSIVVACLYYIFRNLFVNTEPEAGIQTKLF